MSIKRYNSNTKQWEVEATNKASAISIVDLKNNFKSKNVEGALRELGDAKEQTDVDSKRIDAISNKLNEHITNHPGGSGGTGGSLPTIESKFEIDSADAQEVISIPIYFVSPNLGEGICYISINGIEVSTQKINQGDNNIKIGPLGNGVFTIELKVKDRGNYFSNKLSWTITCGGIEINLLSDFNTFIPIGKEISFDYEIVTNLKEKVTLYLTIDGQENIIETSSGKHSYTIEGLDLGVHPVTYYATVGKYKTNTYDVNIVITNSESLYLSSKTKSPLTVTDGNPVVIDYTVSKISEENLSISFVLDGVESKGSIKSGAYTWSNNSLSIGTHTLSIVVKDSDKNSASLSFEINVVEDTEFERVEGSKYKLIAWWDASDNKNNLYEDRNIWRDKISGIEGTLHNFNYTSNGWMNNLDTKEYWLECNGNTYVEIPYAPFENNFENGGTIDILFKTSDVGNVDARVLDITDSTNESLGCFINTYEAYLRSESHKSLVTISEDEYVRVTFVIDRDERYGKVYVDGIPTDGFSLTDAQLSNKKILEDFSHNGHIYINSTKGNGYGSCCIKHLRIYDRALTHNEVITLMISDIEDRQEQRKKYNFCFDNKTMSKMYLTFNRKNLDSDKNNKIPLDISYDSPDTEQYGNGFSSNKSYIYAQGTSSLGFVIPNFNIELKDNAGNDMLYNPFNGTAKEEILFCLKANYMDSSNIDNVALAAIANDLLFDENTYNPAQIKDMQDNNLDKPEVRHTIAGFHIMVYVKDTSEANPEFVPYGVYSFNTDRYSSNTFGYTQYEDGQCLSYEAAANTQSGAAAFNAWTEQSGKSKVQYYKDEFKLIYPPSRDGNDSYDEISKLVEWVDSAGIENFKADLPKHFNVTHLLRYYIFVNVFGLVDSLGKNMKLTSFDGGTIWYPQLYDMDTCLGLNNEGLIKFDVDIEPEHDSTSEDDNTAFNTSASKLWVKLHDFMWDELKDEYQQLRANKLTLENIMHYIYDLNIAKIPETYYAESMQQKYLNFRDDYLTVMHGSRYHHIKKWIKERLLYMDTLMDFNAAINDYVTIRAQAANVVNIGLEPYSPMYVKVKWTNAGDEDSLAYSTVRVRRGETADLVSKLDSNDQEVMIYGGQYIKRLKNLTSLKPKTLLLSAATKLIDLECHSPILLQLAINKCKLLQNVDISDCSSLGTDSTSSQVLDLTGCTNLRYINAYNTKLQGIITDTTGGNLEKVYYPYSTNTIELYNQNSLKVVGIPTEIIYDKQINHTLNKLPEALNRIKLYNCPKVETLRKEYSDYKYFEDNFFLPLYFTKTIELDNSLDSLNVMNFSYCNSLTTLALSNLDKLNILNLNNLNISQEQGTLKIFDISGCDNLERLNINYDNNQTTEDIYYPNFAKNFVLDLSLCRGLKYIYSNFPIKGIKELILPTFLNDDDQIVSNIKELVFIDDTGSNKKSSLEYIYTRSSDDENKNNIDFKDIELENIILQTVDIPSEITNLYLKVANADNININKYRSQNNQIHIIGTYDFSNFADNNMNSLFKGLDLSDIQLVSNSYLNNVTDLTSCFEDVTFSEKTNIDNFISKFNNISILNKTFKNTKGLNIGPNINMSNVSSTIEMFYNSDISSIYNYDLSNVTNSSYMFYNCLNLILNDNYIIDLSKCTNNNYMFYNCKAMTKIKFKSENSILTSIYTFANCIALISIELYNTGAIKDMSYIFYNCKELQKIPDLDTQSVKKLNYSFYNCKNITGTADPNTYWLNEGILEYALCFANCSKLTNFYLEPPEGVPDEWGGLYDSIGENDMELKITPNTSSYALKNFLPSFYSSYSHNLLKTNYSAWQIYPDNNVDACLIEPIAVNESETFKLTGNKLQSISIISVDSNNNYLSTIINLTDTADLTFTIPEGCSYINILYRVYGVFSKIKECDAKLINTDIENTKLDYTKMSITKTDGSISTDSTIPISDVSSIYIKFDPSTVYIDFSGNNYIEEISSIDLSNCPICDYMFSNCENLKKIESLNIENVKSMVGTFYNCRKIETVNGIDTSMCEDISDLFYDCINLKEVSSLSLKKIKYIDRTFYNCSNLTKVEFDSLENAFGMYYTFYNCSKLTKINNLNTKKSKIFDYTFYNCSKLVSIDNIDMSNANSMIYTFYNCSSLASNLSLYTEHVTNMTRAFYGCSKLKTISYLDTSSVLDAVGLFESCVSLVSIPILNYVNIKSMQRFFYNCSSIREITFANTENVTDLSRAFYGCELLQKLVGLNTVNVTNMTRTFFDCISLDNITIDVSSLVNMSYAFSDCSNLYTVKFDNNSTTRNVTDFSYAFNNCSKLLNVPSLDTSKASNLSYIFSDCNNLVNAHLDSWTFESIKNLAFIIRNCKAISQEDIDTITSWTLDNITNISGLLYGLSITSFDVSNWNTSNVTNMTYLFSNSTNLEKVIGLENLNLDNIKSLDYLFYNCNSLKAFEVPDWDVSKITTMQYILCNCTSLSSLNISNWNTSKITSLYNSFSNSGLSTLDLSNLDLSSVTTLQNMAYNCSNLETVRINTNYPSIIDMTNIFSDCPKLKNIPSDFYLNGACSNAFNNCTSLVEVNNIVINSGNENSSTYIFNNCVELTTVNSIIINSSNSIGYMFNNCTNLVSVNNFEIKLTEGKISLAYVFNYCLKLTTINGKTTNTITDINHLFYNCRQLAELDLSNWQIQNVTNASYAFYGCSLLKTITVGTTWNTSLIQDMSYMFSNCPVLVKAPYLNMDNCETIYGLFYGCSSLQEITDMQTKTFESANVVYMDYAFYNCVELLYLPKFNTSSCISMNYTFNNCSKMSGVADALSYWNRTPAVSDTAHTRCFYKCSSLDNYKTEIPYSWKGENTTKTLSASNINNEPVTLSLDNEEKEKVIRQINELYKQIELLNEKIQSI